MTRKGIKILSLITLLALLAVTALSLFSCGNETPADTSDTTPVESVVDTAEAVDTSSDTDAAEVTVTIEITDDKGEKTSKEYTSSAATLADLLKENDLVEGEDSAYGFYITAVNGITADYEKDGAYWALYKNGEYMMTGADGETLEAGAVYGLVYTKG
ncbi:MAG: DUF4430 domain-containing protein [Clostridia bacterium]|nr:DUF4430 domain-containing protein [Clostridia bacterium]